VRQKVTPVAFCKTLSNNLEFFDETLQFVAFLAERKKASKIYLRASEKTAGESLTGLINRICVLYKAVMVLAINP